MKVSNVTVTLRCTGYLLFALSVALPEIVGAEFPGLRLLGSTPTRLAYSVIGTSVSGR